MRTRLILFFCFVFAALLVPIATPAQQTITCESNDGGRKHCGPPNPGQVTLQRQISGSECIQDRSWGVDDRGLWVDRGCRADFLIGGSNDYDNGAGRNVTRRRHDQVRIQRRRRKYCGQVDPRSQVTIQQQISGSPCEQGRSWGVDNRGLWVDRGCRAIFATGGGWRRRIRSRPRLRPAAHRLSSRESRQLRPRHIQRTELRLQQRDARMVQHSRRPPGGCPIGFARFQGHLLRRNREGRRPSHHHADHRLKPRSGSRSRRDFPQSRPQ